MTITAQPTTRTSQLDELRNRINGEILTPEHPEYEASRLITSRLFDHHPRAIVRCASSSDVAESVRFARTHGFEVSIRSGGHSVSGKSVVDGALVIDMSRLNSVIIDPEARTVRAQPGATSRDIVFPAHAYGLSLTTGDTASVGIGGLATGGGIGWMVRKHGLTIDSLLSARIVTADGDEIIASQDENPDLFWAIRGGGGNFGIITEFEFKLAAVGQVLGGVLMLPATREVIRAYLEYADSAPDDLTTIAEVTHAPPAPFVPDERVGDLTLAVYVVWAGKVDEGNRAIAPLRALGRPIADTVAPMPYPQIYEYTAPAEEPHLAEVRSMFSSDLSDEAIDAMLESVNNATSPYAFVQLRVLGGAFARVNPGSTAFAHRDARYMTTILGLWLDPAEDRTPHKQWTDALWARIRGESTGVYVNFLQNEEPERLLEAYPAPTLTRLRQIKAKYDRENFFRFNENIQPA
jgi:FAD/FMN-containing dehydrogenase